MQDLSASHRSPRPHLNPDDLHNTHSVHIRTMCAGPCTEVLKVGELECPCPCRQGIFQMSSQDRKGHSLLPLNSTIREAHEELEAIIPPPTRCLRKETVLKVVDVLASENVVLVRGTPASGKTTLFEYTLLND